MPRRAWQDNTSASFSSVDLCLTVFLIWFSYHSSQQVSLPFLLQTLIYFSVPYSDTGHACCLMRLFRSSGELETMVPIILLATLSIAQENLCAGGYCFLLALFLYLLATSSSVSSV